MVFYCQSILKSNIFIPYIINYIDCDLLKQNADSSFSMMR